jgi:hypothetical protein
VWGPCWPAWRARRKGWAVVGVAKRRARIAFCFSSAVVFAAPLAALGANVTLVSPPLAGPGSYNLPTGRWYGAVVNVGKGSVVATVQFCDAGDTCVGGGDGGTACVDVTLASGEFCVSQLLEPQSVLFHVQIQLSASGPIEARGALYLIDSAGSFAGAVEAQ